MVYESDVGIWNTFDSSGSGPNIMFSAQDAGGYVVRHCNFTVNITVNSSAPQFFECHGNQGVPSNPATPRGTYVLNIYSNTFNCTGLSSSIQFITARAGSGLLFSNSVTGTATGLGIYFHEEDIDPTSSWFTGTIYDPITNYWIWGNTSSGTTYDGIAQPGYNTQDYQGNGVYFSNLVASPIITLTYPHPLVTAQDGGTNSPAITQNPSAVTNFSGTTLNLSVTASGGTPLSYQWRQNTNSVSGQTSTSFSSNNVQTTSSGWYDCVVTNGGGSVTSSVVYVQITNAPPTIATQPTGKTVSVGDTISLSTVATGSTPLSYQWRLNSVALSGATSSSYTTNNAQTNNSGSYTCVVTNSYGSITTSVASVTVLQDLAPHVANWWTNSALAFNSYNTAVTVSGLKPMLVVFTDSYSSGGNKVTNVTFNSVNMTQLYRTNYYSTNGAMDIWFMANPTPASANVTISGTSVAESLVVVVLVTNAPTAWALFEPPQGNYTAGPSLIGSDTINQPSLINELVLDAVVAASSACTPASPQTLINRVTQSTQTVLQASWNRSLGVYTPMTWSTTTPDTITHVSVSIAQAHPNALPTKLTISNVRVSNIKIP
jgi:hypothetical protein